MSSHNTVVSSIMTKDPFIIAPATSLREAAEIMRKINCGILPIGTKNKILGILTDRDIAVRAIARNDDIITRKAADYMTERVITCQTDDTLEKAAEIMRRHQVSRLVVRNQNDEIAGILSFGDILRKAPSVEEVITVVKRVYNKKAAA